jgi:hypothetical protein
MVSAIVVHHNTQACSLANSISTFDAFIPLALIGSALIYLADLYVSGSPRIFLLIFVWPSIPLLAIVVWFFHFGRFKIGDEDYLRAKHEMWKSLGLWSAFLLVELLIVAVWWLRTPAI